MPGGLIQLNAYGAQNQYLNGNPQMTFFKSVYRRYTNFAIENIRLELDGPNELSMEKTCTLRAKIDRNGDLISKMYFSFDLPDIYSGYYKDTTTTNIDSPLNRGYRFRWVNAIGTTIIRNVSISIGGNTVSTLYGEWIKIWHELFAKEKKEVFDEMIGNVPELFAPEYSIGRSSTYPTSTLDPSLSYDPEVFSSSKYLKNPYLKPPSIRGRTIYTPIPFWFATNPGLALPLLCLQYHDVYVNIELRRLSELYTIIETDPNNSNYSKRVAPDLLRSDQLIGNFITLLPSTQFSKPSTGNEAAGSVLYTPNVSGWGFDPHLDVEYIFLDDDERTRFAAVSHEYLIEQVVRQDFLGVIGSATMDLNLNNPIKTLIWGAVRDDFEKTNIYNNYTNWPYEDINVDSVAYMRNTFGEVSYSENITGGYNEPTDYLYDAYVSDQLSSKFNFNYFSKDIIENATLLFNGVERFAKKDNVFFNYVQGYQHPLNGVVPGLQMYSFSLQPTLDQPSGACNMSRIKTIQLQVETIDVLKDANGKYENLFNIYVYAINYNIFRVLGGMGNVGYTN